MKSAAKGLKAFWKKHRKQVLSGLISLLIAFIKSAIL